MMKRMIFVLFVGFLLWACKQPAGDAGAVFSPPEWLQGEWVNENDIVVFTITDDNIIFKPTIEFDKFDFDSFRFDDGTFDFSVFLESLVSFVTNSSIPVELDFGQLLKDNMIKESIETDTAYTIIVINDNDAESKYEVTKIDETKIAIKITFNDMTLYDGKYNRQ